MSKSSIIFRADGNHETGLGHITRSSALADMLKDHFHCILATRCSLRPVLETIQPGFSEVISLPEINYVDEANAFQKLFPAGSLVVLDGYSFNSDYQEILVNSGFDLICIDDIHAFRFYAKAIINHSGGLSPLDYQGLPSTQFYLGPQYALLRKPFLEAAKSRRMKVTDKNCFVCFGGADPVNKTLEVLMNRDQIYFDHFHVVTGSAYQFSNELDEYINQQDDISVYHSVSTDLMVELMSKCSFAICSPSSVLYEYLSVGGIVFLEKIADNQKDVIRYFTGEGMAFRLDERHTINVEKEKLSFQKQAYYFDGRSGERFVKIFRQYFDSGKLKVRKASASDLLICFNWANDENVRQQSFSQNHISLEEHTLWFNRKLEDPDSFFYILEMDGQPVAQVRFQLSGGEVVLGYLADSSIRSKGLGTSILGKGIDAFTGDYSKPVSIIGFVKESNLASQRSFERLAFRKEKALEYPDSIKYIMYHGN